MERNQNNSSAHPELLKIRSMAKSAVVIASTSWLPLQAKGSTESSFPVAARPVPDAPSAQDVMVGPRHNAATMVRLDVPVSWHVTRARILGHEAATHTENFREIWTLELSRGSSFLRSSRARVRAYPQDLASVGELPRSLVVSESNFARLLGLNGSWNEPDEIAQHGRFVQFELSPKGSSGIDVTLNVSDEEHFAVHLRVGDFKSSL